MPTTSNKSLVVVGSDDSTNYFQTAEGKRYNLGTLSILELLRPQLNGRDLVQALQEIMQTGSCMVSLDLNRVWDMVSQQPQLRLGSVERVLQRYLQQNH